MVMLNFNAAQVQPNAALEAIPTGNYIVIITKSEEKPTKNGQGKYIEFEMTIQGGQYAGRKVFDRLNIVNQNQTAVDIAYSTLSAICHVTGRLAIQDTAQLHGVPFTAVVPKKERDDQPGSGNMTNEVKGYKDVNGNDPGFAGVAGAQQQQAPNWAQQQPPQQQAPQQYAPPQQQQAPVQQYAPPAQQQPVQQYAPPPVQQQAPPAQQVQQAPPAGQAPPPWAQTAPAA
jgi:hypothetical protein